MRGRRGLSGLLAGATGLVAVGLLAPTSSLERLELQTHDLRFRLRGPRPTQARIVIGAIADSTMIAWEEPRILWGPRYAQVIEQAHRAGVTWIGLDFIHSVSGDPYAPAAWSQAGRPLPDQQFAHALAASRRVVLSYLGGIAVAGEGGTRTTAARFTPIPALLFAHEEQPLNLGF
ncbi:MAG: CHASE2 domain-containing protein, partial [Armatimonadetes bacterium]|nr:CHASE2 domain-containing protein [Armatimonadota bacterium]